MRGVVEKRPDPSPGLLGAAGALFKTSQGLLVPCLEANPCGSVLRGAWVYINRDSDAAPRTCLPPAGSCPEVGGYMRGVVEKRPDLLPRPPSGS
jgi:hypothetical protein